MKKAILLAIVLLLVSGAAFAQPPIGYIGLFNSPTHDSWCATGAGFYPVEMYIWCLPGLLGQICAEFRICYPVNVIQSTVTWNDPIISVTLGDLASGLSVCYILCQYDWHWIAHQLIYVTDPTPTYVEVCPHPGTGMYQFANCEPGYPTEPCIVLTNLYLNYLLDAPECLGTATQDASWGAIKSMMD